MKLIYNLLFMVSSSSLKQKIITDPLCINDTTYLCNDIVQIIKPPQFDKCTDKQSIYVE